MLNCSLNVVVEEEVNKTIQFVFATLINTEQLKLEEEECLRHVIVSKDAEVFGKSLSFQLVLLIVNCQAISS